MSEEPRFNDDILIAADDIRFAKAKYPAISHVLINEKLRTEFVRHDDTANAAKRKSRRWGQLAIWLAVVALLLASANPVYEDMTGAHWLGLAAAVCGILSVPIGMFGLMYGPSRREWLQTRLMTERLRQFHFQAFVNRLPEIVESMNNRSARIKFEKERNGWLDSFLNEYRGSLDAKLWELVDGGGDVWLHPEGSSAERYPVGNVPAEFFEAYRELRIKKQIDYANYMLRNEGGAMMPARRQAAIVSGTSFLAIMVIFAVHIVIAMAIALSPPLAHSSALHILVVWSAVIALAAKAYEEGWRPEQEISRYGWYAASAKSILARFDDETSTVDDKLALMQEMERLAFEEMRGFLREGSRSRFVM